MRQQFVPPDLAARSLETFGLEDRLLLLQEEAGELGVAISHFRRGRCGAWQEVMENWPMCWWWRNRSAPARAWQRMSPARRGLKWPGWKACWPRCSDGQAFT